MTRDDIIRIAEQAGFVIDKESKQFQPNCISATHHVIDEPLTRFAALVAAIEQAEKPRQWQGLTADEIWQCNTTPPGSDVGYHICMAHQNVLDFAEAIEAKLKEKNT